MARLGRSSRVQPKYTHYRGGNNGRWVLEKAIPRFDEIQAQVVADRKSEGGIDVEMQILEEWKIQSGRRKKRKRSENMGYLKITCYDDDGNVVPV